MLDGVKLFFITEVKKEHVQKSEKIGNFFLRPAQYLWHGKKIDFVQSGADFASQHDVIYKPAQRSWLKAVLMVIALVPATIIGSIFKGYATLKYHNAQHTAQFKACLAGVPNQFVANNQGFFNKITQLVGALTAVGQAQHIFFSEIQRVDLKELWTVTPQPNGPPDISYDGSLNDYNNPIMENIDLLYNLSILNVQDYYGGKIPANAYVNNKKLKSLVDRNVLILAKSRDGFLHEAARTYFSRTLIP